MKSWYYVSRMCPEVITVLGHASGPGYLLIGDTRRPTQGNGYGFFQAVEEARSFLRDVR